MALARLTCLLRNLLHKQREERELDAEVRAHELLLVDEKIRAGMKYLRDHNDVFSHMFAADSELAEITTAIVGRTAPAAQARTETVRLKLVSGDYFNTLGITPAAGQFFSPDADRARGGAPVAVISYAYWKQRFGLEPSALGRTIQVKSTSFEIMGVAPPGFWGETVGAVPDAWVPITMQDAIYPGRDRLSPSPDGQLNQLLWLQAIGRRKSGITNAQANASMNLTFKRLVESSVGPGLPEDPRRELLGQRVKVQSAARGSTLQSDFGQPLKFLMALVALVLLIG